MAQRPDPIRLEVIHQLLAALCEEGGAVLQRAAVSPNIRERRDFSFALFDADARLVAQAAHIPVHLGSAGESVHAVRDALDLEPGDVAILNDPYRGGTHLPDITLVRPVFLGAARHGPTFFLVDRAHHADVGGAVPGSMGIARDLHGEGLVIPPVKLREAGAEVPAVRALIAANVRRAEERLLDLRAQEAALELAEQRLRALCAGDARGEIEAYCGHLMDYAEALAREAVGRLRAGTWRAEDQLDDDGSARDADPLPIRLALRVARGGDGLRFDWRGSAPQARGGVNANRGIVVAASVYALRCLCPQRLPTNEGLFRVVDVVTEPGSLLDPVSPAPVAGGNVETSQRLVDVCFEALAQAAPAGTVPAASAGTMSNLTLGGTGFSIYETLPGGAGAGAHGDGASALQTHMTNTSNTPVEETERSAPLRIRQLTVRRGSGGRGARRGGDGLIKEVEVLEPAAASLFADRWRAGPAGRDGGGAGQPWRARMFTPEGRSHRLAAKTSVELAPGARLRIETPGGGGHGGGHG